jgi:hypothetical protein
MHLKVDPTSAIATNSNICEKTNFTSAICDPFKMLFE